MFTNVETLIVNAIDHLQTLSEVFSEELADASATRGVLSRSARTNEEIVSTIAILLPKLEMARRAEEQPTDRFGPRCLNCE